MVGTVGDLVFSMKLDFHRPAREMTWNLAHNGAEKCCIFVLGPLLTLRSTTATCLSPQP